MAYYTGKNITFTDASTQLDANPSFTWDFGDGSPIETGNAAIHQYATPTTYTVTHTVTNGCGNSSTCNVLIDLINEPTCLTPMCGFTMIQV